MPNASRLSIASSVFRVVTKSYAISVGCTSSPNLTPSCVEDVHDRAPPLGEVLVRPLDLAEVVRRERVDQVPDRRAREAVHLLDAEPRRSARRVLHPLGGPRAHALRLAVAVDLRRQDRPVALVDAVADRLSDEMRADREHVQVVALEDLLPRRGSTPRRRAPCRPRSGRPSTRARGRRSPSRRPSRRDPRSADRPTGR